MAERCSTDKNSRNIKTIAIALIAIILIVDQVFKIWVKTHMTLGEEIHLVGRSARLYFTENPGFAFGIELFGEKGKILLTIFRLIFISAIAWFIVKQIRTKAPKGIIIGLSIMFAGACGNLIDCLFYGVIFNESTYTTVAQMFHGGYAPLGYGKVVDMLSFPIINTTWPQWFPIFGGESLVFFGPIFNIADAAITVSVFYLILFQRSIFMEKDNKCEINKNK